MLYESEYSVHSYDTNHAQAHRLSVMTRPSVDMTKLCGYLGARYKDKRTKSEEEDNSSEALRVRMIGKVTMAR